MIRKKQPQKEIVVDLTGPDGNANVLISLANRLAIKLDYQPEERAQLTTDMMGGDYENLLQVFDKAFGHFVILERWVNMKTAQDTYLYQKDKRS